MRGIRGGGGGGGVRRVYGGTGVYGVYRGVRTRLGGAGRGGARIVTAHSPLTVRDCCRCGWPIGGVARSTKLSAHQSMTPSRMPDQATSGAGSLLRHTAKRCRTIVELPNGSLHGRLTQEDELCTP